MDKQLNDSLGSFDARLRKEQQRIAQERDARQATVATSTSTASAAATAAAIPAATADAAGSAMARVRDAPSVHDGDLKSDKRTGDANGGAKGNGALANEVPDGNDDDIVARRLRKAAEQETDPELKDKLWKEYVEYKKNAQPMAAR